jgi:DedD protein
MADRIAESGELAVDDHRRRARRRLVGAIVLALAAAIIVPMLLESEPRPLGDDVAVQIPARDEGRFVNRLTGGASESKSAKPAAGRSQPEAAAVPQASPPPATPAPSPGAPTSAPPGSPAIAPTPAPAAAPATAPAQPATTSPPADPRAAGEPKGVTESAAAPAREPSPAPPAAAPATGGFAVQLAAFTDDKGANALANKLKRANYAAYVEPVNTSRGTLWRVRVGGYATRDEANAARAKLKDEGYSGIVTAVK